MNTLLGIGAGALWGALNLYFIQQLLYEILLAKPKKPLKIIIITFIKFPLLYTVGYVLLLIEQLSPWDLLIGFSLGLVLCSAYRLATTKYKSVV